MRSSRVHDDAVTARNRLSHPSSLVWRIFLVARKAIARERSASVNREEESNAGALRGRLEKCQGDRLFLSLSPFTFLISWRLRGRTIVRAKRVLLSDLAGSAFSTPVSPDYVVPVVESRTLECEPRPANTPVDREIESRRPGCITRRRGICPGAWSWCRCRSHRGTRLPASRIPLACTSWRLYRESTHRSRVRYATILRIFVSISFRLRVLPTFVISPLASPPLDVSYVFFVKRKNLILKVYNDVGGSVTSMLRQKVNWVRRARKKVRNWFPIPGSETPGLKWDISRFSFKPRNFNFTFSRRGLSSLSRRERICFFLSLPNESASILPRWERVDELRSSRDWKVLMLFRGTGTVFDPSQNRPPAILWSTSLVNGNIWAVIYLYLMMPRMMYRSE